MTSRSPAAKQYTGCFIRFSVITNIYNKKTKGPTLMELFRATEKLIYIYIYILQLEMVNVYTIGNTAHIDTIFQVLVTHASKWVQ